MYWQLAELSGRCEGVALRIGDVAMLARERISADGHRWRIFLLTKKSAKPYDLKAAMGCLPVPKGSQANRDTSLGTASASLNP